MTRGDEQAQVGAGSENGRSSRETENTAYRLHAAEPVERYVTTDASQGQAARDLGFPV